MIIAICVQPPHIYQQLSVGLRTPEMFQFYDYHPFRIGPPVRDFESLTSIVKHGQVDLVILDKKHPFYQKAHILCKENAVECIDYIGDIKAVIHEVDMFASFYMNGEPDGHESTDPSSDQSMFPKEVVVKIGEKIVEKEVERLRYTNIPQKVIVIGSLWTGAGSTLYSVNLARAIADRQIEVSYVEFPKNSPYVFDYLNLTQLEKDLGIPYKDYAKHPFSVSSKVRGFRFKGIQWVVNDSRLPPSKEWLGEDMMPFIYSLRDSPIVIVDVSYHWNDPSLQPLLSQADHVYVCIEPDPVKIDRTTVYDSVHDPSCPSEFNSLKTLHSTAKDFDYIELKMNEKLKVRTWHECLEKPPITSLALIPYEDVMESVWQSTFLYDNPRYHKTFEKSFLPILTTILPRNYVNRKGRNHSRLFKKWMKRSEA